MSRRNRLGPTQRRLVYGLTLALVASGIGWFVLDRFLQIDGEFGPSKHAWQHPLLVLHGVAAMLYLMALGSLVGFHVRRGWALRRQRGQALFFVGVQAVLVLTAPALYYVGDETLRPLASNLHLGAGFLLAAALPVHVWLGRREHRLARAAGDAFAPSVR